MWPFKKQQKQEQTQTQPQAVLATDEPTLKTNVTAFWEWFTMNAERFYETIQDKRCGDLTDEVIAAVDRWLPHMGWVFGPGENRIGHSFTLTGEDVLIRQFVAEYWLSRAPKLPNLTFYASRQPSENVGDFTIKIADDRFRSAELWIATYLDEQDEKIDIMAWHPLFAKMEESAQFRVLFLLLDEALGEHGTGNWIGEIKIGTERLKDAFPISELREFTEKVQADKGWKKCKPTEGYSLYEINERPHGFPRADIYVGSTRNYRLVRDYVDAEGDLEHPLKGMGVDLVFVNLNATCLPEGEAVDFRSKIDDALIAALEADHSGISFGGASGTEWAYIDLMLYDGQRSLDKVLEVLRQQGLPDDTHVRWFTNDQAGRVVTA